MTRLRLSRLTYAATLLTLPWIGLGVVRATTGRDIGAGIQPAWLLLVVTMALGWRDLGERPAAVLRATPPTWRLGAAAIAVTVLVSGFGLLVAPSGEPATATILRFAKQVVQLGIMAAFTAWAALWTRDADRWRWTARWLVAGALVQAAYGLLQELHYFLPGGPLPLLERLFTSNPAILSGSEELYVGGRFLPVPRLRGTACEPLYLGNYLLAVLPLVALTGWRTWARRTAAVVLVGLLLLTWSRGAWLAGAGAAAAAFLVAGCRTRDGARSLNGAAARRRAWTFGAVAVAVLIGALIVLGPERALLPWRRLVQTLDTSDWSNLTRLYSMQAGWRAFLLSPVCGVGWGQFGWHFPALVDPMGLQAMVTWPVVSNYFLQILCETGLLGAATAAAVVFGHVRQVRDRCRGARLSPELAATLAAMTGVALQLLTFSQYNLPHIWVAWGLLLAAGRIDRRPEAGA